MKINSKILAFALLCSVIPSLSFANEATQNQQKQETAQQLFEQSLELLKPLSDEQIKQFREFSRQQEEAIAPSIPHLGTRTVRVKLEPGNSPTKVFTTANTVTALVFHDVTGSPWEVTSLTNGSPAYFQILKPEIPEGNLVNILPLQSNASSNLIITLKDKDIPLVIALQSDNVKSSKRNADSMLLIQIAQMGPKAIIPVVERIEETVSSSMMSFLDQVPPEGARLVNTSSNIPNFKAWQYQDKLFVRTTNLLVFPSWTASVNGANSVKCYEISSPSSRLLLSVDGKIQTIDLEL